jgi:hypothetical protein
VPIIGVGGIHGWRARGRKIEAGASLVQVYSGFIYRGPALMAKWPMLPLPQSGGKVHKAIKNGGCSRCGKAR